MSLYSYLGNTCFSDVGKIHHHTAHQSVPSEAEIHSKLQVRVIALMQRFMVHNQAGIKEGFIFVKKTPPALLFCGGFSLFAAQ